MAWTHGLGSKRLVVVDGTEKRARTQGQGAAVAAALSCAHFRSLWIGNCEWQREIIIATAADAVSKGSTCNFQVITQVRDKKIFLFIPKHRGAAVRTKETWCRLPSSDVLVAQRVTPPQIAFTNLLLVGESAGQLFIWIAHANFESSVLKYHHLVFVS
jgi:hypothetical protein